MSIRNFFRKRKSVSVNDFPARAADSVAVGLYGYAIRPGPHGIDDVGRRFLETHGGDAACFGWILWRLHHLEEREP